MAKDWPDGWFVAEGGERGLLEEELKKELAKSHPLARVQWKIVARRCDRDDVLLTFDEGGNGRVAEVHLTWSSKKEADPRWPRTSIFDSIDVWRLRSDPDLVR
jgi:hypothetical protein